MNKHLERSWLTYKGLWLLSIPSIVSSMLEPISSVVDTALVGHFSTDSLAALAVGTTVMSAFTWMFNFLIHAPIQAISQRIGQGDYKGVASLFKLSVLVCMVLSILLILGLYPLRFTIYGFMNLNKELALICNDYFSIRLLGHFGILAFTVTLSTLRGFARVNSALILISITTVLNIAISYLSLYHFNFGISGVAYGTVISNFIGFIISLVLILRLEPMKKYIKTFQVDKALALEFGQKSMNVFGRSLVLTTCFFMTTKVASYIGHYELAAHQIILQVWLFISFFTDGVATSSNIIGARIYGSANKELYSIYKKNIIMGLQIGAVFTLVLFVFKTSILSLFTSDPLVLKKIDALWPIIALTQIPLSIAYVYDGLLFGINRFDYLRKHMFVGFIFIYLPICVLAYQNKSLFILWWGLIGIGLYRLLSNFICIRDTFKGVAHA